MTTTHHVVSAASDATTLHLRTGNNIWIVSNGSTNDAVQKILTFAILASANIDVPVAYLSGRTLL